LRRLPHRARALEVVKLPESAIPGARPVGRQRGGFSPSIIEGSGQRVALRGRPAPESDGATEPGSGVEVPVLGRIAAGTPIEALQNESNRIAVPQDLLASGEHYALEVVGDSMIEAGILEGDVVVLQRCDTASNGDIVVALVDETEATLKRL